MCAKLRHNFEITVMLQNKVLNLQHIKTQIWSLAGFLVIPLYNEPELVKTHLKPAFLVTFILFYILLYSLKKNL